MMRKLAAMTAVLCIAACAPSDPVAMRARNINACETALLQERQIAACSAVVADAAADPAQRAAALVQRGVARAGRGQHARAVADFGRALRLDPANGDALAERGAVHQERGAYELALRDYEAALAIDPRHAMAAHRRQQALQGQVDAVSRQIEQLSELIAREPGNAAALNNRCWLRAVHDGDLTAALADCDAALRIQPSANTLDSRGLVRLKRGEFDAALADYEAALALEPNRGHYLFGRGLARRQLGELELGEADLRAAEAAEPGVTQAYAGYGRLPESIAPPAAQKSDRGVGARP